MDDCTYGMEFSVNNSMQIDNRASTVFACLPCAVSLIMQRLHGETETKAGIERAEQKQTATGHEANRQHQKQCAEMRKKGSGTGVRI